MFSHAPNLTQGAIQHFQRGDRSKAADLLLRALAAQPRDFDALHLLGVIRAMDGKLGEAIELFRKALGVSKNNAALQFNLAKALSDLGMHDEALLHHRKATQLAPSNAEAWLNLGLCLQSTDDLQGAMNAVDEALRLAPAYAQAWNNKGNLLKLLDKTDEALVAFESALRINPSLAEVHLNKGAVLEDLGRETEALTAYREAVRLKPEYLDARWAIATLQLKHGNYEEGWADFEHRWSRHGSSSPKLRSGKPLWDGTRNDQPLLLWGEQGIGDQILYASILPELVDFPQRKLLALDARLHPLFRRSLSAFELLDLNAIDDALPFSVHLPLGSLPRHFRKSAASFAGAHHPYLAADPQRATALRTRLVRPGKLICGVSWSSNRKIHGPGKSIPLDKLLPPLSGLPLHFVNLQYGATETERQQLQQSHGIIVEGVDEIDNFNDMDGLAALIEACDLVLTTSNSTAHLAGALGKSTLLLLPSGPFWYWSAQDGCSTWYPSVKLFRQTQPGSWAEPLDHIFQYLQEKYGT